jgi:hypothetical protein
VIFERRRFPHVVSCDMRFSLRTAGSVLLGFPGAARRRAMKVAAGELKECEDKVEKNRAVIRSRETDKKSMLEQHSFERNKITKQLEAARLDEQKELTALRTSLQSKLNSNRNQWKALNQQETVALQNISSTLGVQLSNLRHQISDLTQAESSELSKTLATQQEQFVTNYLRGWHIDSASIPGIGPGYKSRLRMVGILSAADVDYRVHSVKGFGATRSAALSAWQRPLKARGLQNMPKALSPADSIAIKDKYASTRQSLSSQKEFAESKVKDAEATVRTQFTGLREPLDKEEVVEKGKMQLEKETIENRFRERYKSLNTLSVKLDDDLKHNIADIEDKSAKDRRNLLNLHWEQEKVRRRMVAFRDIRFSVYAKRIIGL